MTNGPFYALLAYIIIRDFRDVRLIRSGLRKLTEGVPPPPRQKKPAAAAREVDGQEEWPGDGYRPKTLDGRRTG